MNPFDLALAIKIVNTIKRNVRLRVIVLLALAAATAYLTRHALAAAATTIQKDLSISDEEMGWVLAAFSAGYFFCQVPGGWLGNRIGTRAAFPLISVLWSSFHLMTIFTHSFLSLFLLRFCYGAAQAGMVPLSAKVLKDWIPEEQRGIASALIGASMSIGGVVAMWLTGSLLGGGFDWKVIFASYTLVGLVWAFTYYSHFRTFPNEHPSISLDELEIIQGRTLTRQTNDVAEEEVTVEGERVTLFTFSGRESDELDEECRQDTDLIVRKQNRFGSILALHVQSFFRAAGYGLFVSWFPAILQYRFDLSVQQAGGYAAIPLIGVIAGSTIGGFTVDFLQRQFKNRRLSRSYVAVVALTLSGLLTVGCSFTSHASVVLVLMGMVGVASGAGSPSAWAATMDVAGNNTAVVMGSTNMAGTAGGFAMPVILGYIIGDIRESAVEGAAVAADWNVIFYFVAVIYGLGALAWLFVNPESGPGYRDE